MKIGVWLPLSPLSEWKYEGLVRLLGFVLSGVTPDQRDTYEIVVPNWVKPEDIDEFLGKFSQEQRRKIGFRRFEKGNILLQLAVWIVERQNDVRKKRGVGSGRIVNLLAKMKRGFGKFLLLLTSSARWDILGVLSLLLLTVGGVVAGIVGLVIGLPLYIVYRLVRYALRRAIGDRKSSVTKKMGGPTRKIAGLFSPIDFIRSLTENELKYMAERVENDSQIDCWYIPHVGYKSGVHLKGVKVFLFADFVFHDAPSGFSPDAVSSARKMFANVLSYADGLIAISNHVSERHIQNQFNYPKENIHVIPHGYVDISGKLDILQSGKSADEAKLAFVEKTTATKEFAAQIIKKSLNRSRDKNPCEAGSIYGRQLDYVRKMDFSKTEYVLVSTQNRPYKNTLGAIKAVQHYNQHSNRPLKLIMTGDYGIDDEYSIIGNYVRKNGLYFDVLAIPRVPDEVHAALYHCATLALAASFFEGGTGSFVFDEAVSVGTPTLLSRNLSHDEGLQKFDAYPTFSFNPNVPEELAELIKTTLSQTDGKLYRSQWEIANFRAQDRNWQIVQKEYLQAFKHISTSRKSG